MNEMVCTGEMISMYLEENGITIADVAKASDVSEKTVYRVLNDEVKLPLSVAKGIHKLIDGINEEFLMIYDAKYQVQKARFVEDNLIDGLDEIIEYFRLKKLYPSYARDKKKLFSLGKETFGDGFAQRDLDMTAFSSMAFKKANKSNLHDSNVWVTASYNEYCNKYISVDFDREMFNELFEELKDYSSATTFKEAVFNIRQFCKACGINLYLRPSIPNSRIRAVTVKDQLGKIYLFMSDLFKCVELFVLNFVHECVHIKNDDLDDLEGRMEVDVEENERKVDSDVIQLFLGDYALTLSEQSSVVELAGKTDTPTGIVAAILRSELEKYSDHGLNSYIHFFSEKDFNCVQAIPVALP